MAGKHKPQPGVRDSEGRKIPRKYLRGLSAKKQKQMKHEIKSFRDKPDDHKEAYKPWTADRGVKPKKKSKATKLYHRMFGEDVIYESSDSGLAKKAAQSGIPLSILRQVFNRGMAAWKTGHRPGVAQQQWAYGRVNSFITGSGGARKADADLWAKVKNAKKQEESVNLVRTPLLLEGECDTKKSGKPWRTPGGPKKFAVCADGKLVRFGDPNLEIKRDDPERRKNFRARHNCASPGPRTKAKYWACRTWEKDRTVGDVVSEGRLARTLGGLALGAATMFGGASHAKASDNPPSMTYARSNVGELTRRLHQQAGEMQRKDTAETESARSREFAQRRAAIYKMPRHKQAGALNDLHTAFHATPGMTDAVGSHRFMQRVLDRK